MKITVSLIPTEGQSIELTPKLDWVKEMICQALSDEKPAEKTVKGSIEINRVNDQLHFEGSINVDLLPVCSRCLESFSYQLHVPIKMDLAPLHVSKEEKSRKRSSKEEQHQREDEIELSKADLEFSFYKGPEIDLQKILREQIVLALPLRFLCQENCKGLCSNCGVNLNQVGCNCASKDIVDPRWEPLKNIRPKTSDR